MRPTVLGPLHHRCMACGGGCHGTDVQVTPEERQRLADLAHKMGEFTPFAGDFLRKQEGRCVFLLPDQRCRIHAEHGFEAKPEVCRQYPLFARQVGLEIRLGVDPGCLHAWASWEDGPVVEGVSVRRSRGGQPMAWNTEEQALIALIQPRRTVEQILHALGGPGLAARLVDRVRTSQILDRVAHPDTASSLRTALEPVGNWVSASSPGDRGAVPATLERWVVEATRRMVWLRLPADARPLGRALGTLAGALVCGASSSDPAATGPAFAAWCRVIRTPARLSLFPDEEALQAICAT